MFALLLKQARATPEMSDVKSPCPFPHIVSLNYFTLHQRSVWTSVPPTLRQLLLPLPSSPSEDVVVEDGLVPLGLATRSIPQRRQGLQGMIVPPIDQRHNERTSFHPRRSTGRRMLSMTLLA